MTGKNKTSLLGWHPTSAEDAAWIRKEAKREGRGALTRMLDQALSDYRAKTDRRSVP
jgi:hypothetical protein